MDSTVEVSTQQKQRVAEVAERLAARVAALQGLSALVEAEERLAAALEAVALAKKYFAVKADQREEGRERREALAKRQLTIATMVLPAAHALAHQAVDVLNCVEVDGRKLAWGNLALNAVSFAKTARCR